ncbi:hypothetical protein N9L68_05990, partial [bacterium]|nr:hypothetical protein [bacterium]
MSTMMITIWILIMIMVLLLLVIVRRTTSTVASQSIGVRLLWAAGRIAVGIRKVRVLPPRETQCARALFLYNNNIIHRH